MTAGSDVTASESAAAPAAGGAAERLLAATTEAAERLLAPDVDDATIAAAIGRIGSAAEISRVRVFQVVREAGANQRRPRYVWSQFDSVRSAWADGIAGRSPNHELCEVAVDRLFCGRVGDLSAEQRAALAEPDVVAIAVMPIETSRGVWGFVAFDDCVRERSWSAGSLGALRTLSRLLGTVFDRGEHRQRNETLHASYYALLDNLNEGVFQTDDRGRFTYLNGAWAALTGQPPGAALGLFCGDIFDADECDAWRTGFGALLQGEVASHRCEVKLRHADGSSRWVQVSARAFDASARGPRGLAGTIVDISASKQVEQQLIAAKHEAEAASRAKSEFLSTMSHELRTPLNGVIGLSESLLETGPEADPTRTRRYLELIHDSGRRLFVRINDILDLARVEAGRLKLNVASVDVGGLCAAAFDAARADIVAKRLHVEAVRPAVGIMIQADERLLSQALHKLVTNAVKFTPESGRITITAEPRADGGATIAITDTGIGISAEKLHLLFKPFSQVDASLSRRFGGTGLGLALVDKFVRLHGGTISVTSRPDVGSTFTIELPPFPDPAATATAPLPQNTASAAS